LGKNSNLYKCNHLKVVMVLIRNYEGEGWWNGVLIDGYLPNRERLEFLYKNHFKLNETTVETDPKKLTNDDLFYKLLNVGKQAFCHKIVKENPSLVIYRRGKPLRKSTCDLFSFDNEKKNQIQAPLEYFSEEFAFEGHREDYRIIVLMEENCPKPEACIKFALDQAEFIIKQPDQYKNYDKFKNAAEELLENGSCHFNAPCIMFTDDMVRFGFSVYY
jgi:hypothetical protein